MESIPRKVESIPFRANILSGKQSVKHLRDQVGAATCSHPRSMQEIAIGSKQSGGGRELSPANPRREWIKTRSNENASRCFDLVALRFVQF